MHWGVCIAAVLAGVALLLLAWGVFVEPRRFRVRELQLDAPALGFPPLDILHLTDTHFHGRDDAKLRFLRTLAERGSYDLVLFTGDLIHSGDGLDSLEEAAGLFSPRLGSFAVLGGHDYKHLGCGGTYWRLLTGTRATARCRPNPVEEVVRRLGSQGVRVLRDENVRVSCPDGSDFALVGLRDAFTFEPDFKAAWDGVPPDLPVLVLAHSPDVLPEVVRRGAKLAFFGHSHGGQVRLPLLGALVTRSDMPRRTARGAFRCGGTVFVVNAGLGAAPASPYRFLCPPEAVAACLSRRGPPPTSVEEFTIG